MSFDSFAELLAMGGHGLYVWLAFGITTIVMLANAVAVPIARRRYFREARARERRQSGTVAGPGDQNTSQAPLTSESEKSS